MLQTITRIGVAIILLTLALSACSGSEPVGNRPAPTPSQVVEYGASLNEWEEAVGASSQTENTSSMTPVETPTLSLAVPTVVSTPAPRLITVSEDGFWELEWGDLVPADFRPEAIMAKYQDELSQYQDGDPEAMMLYMQMQAEFNNAPANQSLDEKKVKIPGFIAPLEYTDDVITQFLLVPYFGACIHTPPPPVNQTVLVTTSVEDGIKAEDAYNPIWVYGILTAESIETELANAGYSIEDAVIEPYSP